MFKSCIASLLAMAALRVHAPMSMSVGCCVRAKLHPVLSVQSLYYIVTDYLTVTPCMVLLGEAG